MDISRKILRFEGFRLDLAQCSLRSGDKEILLRPKSFDVLRHLAINAGRLVSKRELDDAVWPNVAVTDASLTQCIRELREKLDDSEHTLIKTVHRRGYILTAEVSEETDDGVAPPAMMSGRNVPTDTASRRTTDGGLTPRRAGPESAGVSPDMAASAAQGDLAPRRARRASAQLMLSIVAGALTALIVVSSAAAWFVGYPPLRSAWTALFGPPLKMFRDCGDCPEMVVLPPAKIEGNGAAEFGKQSSGRSIAAGRFEVTVEQFAAFVDKTGYEAGRRCNLVTGAGKTTNLQSPADADFRRQPDKQLTGRHPAGCISWHDAKAYVAWLAETTNRPYRLLTGAEWEYAARAGMTGPYSFEGGINKLCEFGRFADLNSQFPWAAGCRSDIPELGALPVGSLKPNPWGLYDVHGNVWEWVEDCISSDPAILASSEADAGSETVGCKLGVVRGGGWVAGPGRLDAGFRLHVRTNSRGQTIGFRVGLTLDER